MSTTLTFYGPQSYVAATSPVAFVYHIDWPGNDLLNPLYHAYKLDSANNQTEIGLYHSLDAAHSACQTDYTGPQSPAKAPKTLYPGGALQAPIQKSDTIAYASSNFVSKSGDTMTGALILNADPANVLGAVTKQYADAHLAQVGTASWVRVRTANESLNASVANGAVLQFDTIDFDTSGFAPTTSPFSQITVPTGLGGVYIVTAAASGSGTQATTLGLGIIVNNVLKLSETNQAISGPATLNYTLDSDAVEILKLAPGDAVQLKNNSVSTGPNAFKSVFLALCRLGT